MDGPYIRLPLVTCSSDPEDQSDLALTYAWSRPQTSLCQPQFPARSRRIRAYHYHDWLPERYHALALHVVCCRGPLRAHKNSFGALLGSPLLHLQLPVTHPAHEYERPLHVNALVRTPVRLHLVVNVASGLLIRDLGPCKLKARIERIIDHLLSHVDHKSAPSRDKLTFARINLPTSERHNLPVLILGLT
jgi:hypothetical protein